MFPHIGGTVITHDGAVVFQMDSVFIRKTINICLFYTAKTVVVTVARMTVSADIQKLGVHREVVGPSNRNVTV